MFIFGGNTGMSYEDIQRQREIARQLTAGARMPISNVGEGIRSAANAIAGGLVERRAQKAYDKQKAEFDAGFDAIGTAYGMPGGEPQYAAMRGTNPDYASAIGSVESGNRYDALGPVIENPGSMYHGDRAYGKYQVMGRNIPEWTEEVLGRRMTPQEFVQNPQAQDAVFNAKFGESVQRYGNPQDAASVWFSGRPMAEAGNASDGYNTVPQYVQKFNAALGGGGAPQGGGSTAIIARLAEMAASPYADPGQRAVAQALLSQQMQTMDPLRQMQIERAQLELDQMRNPPPDDRRTQWVPGQGLMDLDTGEVIRPDEGGTGGGTDYSLTPQYVTRPDGSLGMIQLGKDGSVNVVEMPEGMALQKGVEKLDLGTTWQWYNTVTGEPIGDPIPKDLRGAEAEKAAGKIEGEAAAQAEIDLPGLLQKSEQAVALIDTIAQDPALASITGNFQGRIPPLTQGGANLLAKINQLQGKVFLEAYESLKGGGVITEIEGTKAENAIARLARTQDDAEFRKALMELREVVNAGARRAREKAGQSGGAAPPAAPSSGTVRRWTPDGGLQ